ncbi:MAG: DUF1932 domain-containing protein [Acidimicrobiia bacterium]|nr:DUF1932 domain-containing protein [Acidimicrobiia bacterium]MDH5237427.1 DUF1932 domain-containing protein [Acidimicrobiia bacterium]
MSATTWGVLHPGAMGASVAAALVSTEHRVLWCSDGRSRLTRQRASEAGAEDVFGLAQLAERADAIVSVCPPGRAVQVAEDVAHQSFAGLYVDANAIAPSTSRRVREVIESGGARMVDGGIVGPPAWSAGSTRLFLSGDHRSEVTAALAGSALETVSLDGGVGAASALKVAYATWTKAVGAVLLAVRAYAEVEGVTEALLTEWDRSQQGTARRSELTAAAVGPKAWRFGDELRELARAMEDVGLPGGFQAAAATVYDRLAPLQSASSVDIHQVVALLGPPAGER